MSLVDPVNEPYVCTFKNPWTPDKGQPAEHPDAFILYDIEYIEELYVVFFCPHCQRKFTDLVPR